MSAEPVNAVSTLRSLPPQSRLPVSRFALVAAVSVATLAAVLGLARWSPWTEAAALNAARSAAIHQADLRSRAATKPASDEPEPASRIADASRADELFAPHSWYIPPPPPPPPPPAPAAEPSAPPFPYTFIGAYTPEGGRSVYFLSRGDRVIDARVGDRLDGVYDFESADSGQLVFNYLPLNIRQPINPGVHP